MPRLKVLSNLQQAAIHQLTLISGYSNSRIAELLLPFMGAVSLKNLYKRICRIQPQHCNKPRRALPEAGSYVIHGIKVQLGSAPPESLLLIMELHTGWLYARLLPRIDMAALVAGVYQVFSETEFGAAKMTKSNLVLLSFEQSKVNTEDTIDASRRLATVIRKPVACLCEEIKGRLRDWHQSIKIDWRDIPSPRNFEPVRVAGEWGSSEEVNQHLRELLDTYNRKWRDVFPRTKGAVCPLERLYKVLDEKQIRFKHKRPERPQYL